MSESPKLNIAVQKQILAIHSLTAAEALEYLQNSLADKWKKKSEKRKAGNTGFSNK